MNNINQILVGSDVQSAHNRSKIPFPHKNLKIINAMSF